MYLLFVFIFLFALISIGIKSEQKSILDLKIKSYNEEENNQEQEAQEESLEEENQVYRPSTFEEYIGQEGSKNILKSYLQAIKDRGKVFPHCIINGSAGTGKSTLVKIVANQLDVKVIETIASSITSPDMLIQKIIEVNGGVLFLDEIHAVNRDMVETIYMVMEDFKYNGTPVKPFTLMGATTELGEMIADRQPFVDRFKLIIELDKYNPKDLSTIAKQYKEKTFPQDNLSDDIYIEIGLNSRGTPRTAIRLVEACIYLNGNIKQVKSNFKIIAEGYTTKDLKILQYLSQNDKGVGLNGLVAYLGTSKANYEQSIEPFLLQNNLLQRTPRGRKITEYGIKTIEFLENSQLGKDTSLIRRLYK